MLSLTPSCLVMVVSYQRESLIFFVLFFSETPPLSVSHSTARLTHASSCGVAIQTIPSSARPRKGRPSTAPCVGMERYRFHYEQRSGGPFLFLISVFLFFSDLLDIFKSSSFRFPDTNLDPSPLQAKTRHHVLFADTMGHISCRIMRPLSFHPYTGCLALISCELNGIFATFLCHQVPYL